MSRVVASGVIATLFGVALWICKSDRSNAAGAFGQSAQLSTTSDAKLKDLLKQRLATLREMADAVSKSGLLADVFKSNLAVFFAELELCETDDERAAVWKRIVVAAKEYEAHAAKIGEAGFGSVSLKAKLSRLDAELGYARFELSRTGVAK